MRTKTITQLGLLLAIALAIQFLRLPAYITGPAINAILIISVVFPGVFGSILIGCITPLAALVLGILNPMAAPLVPVIIAANAALGITFYFLRKSNDYLALTGAALVKFAVFYLSLKYLFGILNIQLPVTMLAAFQIPQLVTAIIGGIVGIGIIKQLEKTYGKPEKLCQKPEEELSSTDKPIVM